MFALTDQRASDIPQHPVCLSHYWVVWFLTKSSSSVLSVGICRFVLRLRQIHLINDEGSQSTTSACQRFLPPVGNIGAPLQIHSRAHDEDHGEDEEVIYVIGNPLRVNIDRPASQADDIC